MKSIKSVYFYIGPYLLFCSPIIILGILGTVILSLIFKLSVIASFLALIGMLALFACIFAIFWLMFASAFSGSAPNGGSQAWNQLKPILFKVFLGMILSLSIITIIIFYC